jgi:hypothetical protein
MSTPKFNDRETRVQLSRDFWLDEFLRSETAYRHGIDMVPPGSVVAELRRLCVKLLQPVRDELGVPLVATSGWRPAQLNTLIGGSDRSDHVWGRAADVHAIGKSALEVCEVAHSLAVMRDLPLKQAIYEFGRWAHLSIAPEGEHARREALTAYRTEAGATAYAQGFDEILARGIRHA